MPSQRHRQPRQLQQQDKSAEASASSSFNDSLDFIPLDFGDEQPEEDDAVERQQVGEKRKRSRSPRSPAREDRQERTSRDKANGDLRTATLRENASKKHKERDSHYRDRNDEARSQNSSGRSTPTNAAARKKERRRLAQDTPWCENLDFDQCQNAAEILHDELIAFAEWITPTEHEHEVRVLVIHLIRRAIQSTWPDAKVEPFGSQNTMLYMPQGDIDLVAVAPSMDAQSREGVLRKMAAVLRRNNLATDVRVIAKAKVPIVKFVCTHGKLSVDISINQTNGLDAAEFVQDWLQRCPPLRPIITATKLLLSQRGLSEVFSGGLGSYSVICMAISHMQLHPKVQRGELDPAVNLGVLFLDFLELFGKNFGYDNVGIRVAGRGGYFPKASRGWRDDKRPFMLSIEDPLDDSNDVSKGSFSIISVRQVLGGAFDILTAAMCQRAKEMTEQRAAEHWDAKVDEDEEARRELMKGAQNPSVGDKDPRSLLGLILGVNRDMHKSKRDLEQLWQGGTLHYLANRKPPGASPEPSSKPARPQERDRSEVSQKRRPTSKDEALETHLTSRGASEAELRGARGQPIIVADDSPSHLGLKRRRRALSPSDDESEMLDESELAASQGFQFSSFSSNDEEEGETEASSLEKEKKRGDEQDTRQARIEDGNDSRYSSKGSSAGGRRFPKSDVFARDAPSAFVDDESGSESERDANHDETASTRKNDASKRSSAATKSQRRSAAKERRQRKNDYWASKGSAVRSGPPSPSPEDNESDDDEQNGVMLHIYD